MLKYQKPNNVKEATIQAELYASCREAGLNCNLQCSIILDCGGWDLPDLIVVEHNQIICIVEVKDYSSFVNLSSSSKNQIKRYKKHDVPVFILFSIYDIPYLIKRLVEVKTKFLESIDSTEAKCFEADRQNEEKWNKKIAEAFSKFDEVFPSYRFTNERSLEILTTGVKVLGLSDLLKLMDESKGIMKDFFFSLNSLLVYRKEEKLQLLRKCHGTFGVDEVNTLSAHHNKLDKIEEKLS